MAIERIEHNLARALDASAAALPAGDLLAVAAPSWQSVYRRSLVTVDVFVCAAALLALTATMSPPWALVVAIVGAFTYVAIALCLRGYDAPRVGVSTGQFAVGVRASGIWVLLIIAGFYLVEHAVPASILVAAFATVAISTQSARALARYIVVRGQAGGRFLTDAVVIGDAEAAAGLIEELGPEAGCRVVGVCRVDHPGPSPDMAIDRARELLAATGARLVIVAGSSLTGPSVRRLGWELESHNVDLLLAPALQDTAPTRLDLRCAGGTPLLSVALRPSVRRVLLKGAFDRAVGIALVAAAAVPLLVLYLLVRLSSQGPGFFVQERVGAGGRAFRMLKLRTMYVDAEARRAALLAESDGNEVMFKMHEDPRVTRVGRVLRRYSLDELPQLLNVVRGDMSLVGPRPPLPEEVSGYTREAMRRLKVKPGLTGLWQVSGRSDLDWEETVRLDLSYVDNWSMRVDLHILLRTFRAVLSGHGAY